MYSTPAALHSSISFLRIGGDALEMSVSARQNFLKPPPVPEMPTVTLMAFFLAFWNSSATASVTGYTVEEPSIFTIGAWASAEPADNSAAPTTVAKRASEGFIECPPGNEIRKLIEFEHVRPRE